MATANSTTLGLVITLSHDDTTYLLNNMGNIETAVTTILDAVLRAVGVKEAYIPLVNKIVAAYFRVQQSLIQNMDKGYGINLTMPWFAVFSISWWFIVPTTVSPPGIGVCPQGGQHEYLYSSDYAIVPNGPGQSHWRWCNKCAVMFWAGTDGGDVGVCPTGGVHTSIGSSDYALVMDVPTAPGQHNWRWCNKCSTLFWAGPDVLEDIGVCPMGGTHTSAGSSDYALVMDVPGAAGQHNWRWCHKCSDLFWAGPS